MSNQDRLLSDEELREYLASNGLPHNEVEGNMIIDLINTQKRLAVESRETELLDALYWMYMQYCGKDGHLFMGAGETASELLENAGYISVDGIGAIIKDNGDSAEQRARIK